MIGRILKSCYHGAVLSDSEPKVKVTDKRMFTPDGELREDYRHLDVPEAAQEGEATPDEGQAPAAAPSAPDEAAASAAEPKPAGASPPQPDAGAREGGGRYPAEATFFDLLGVLAEPIALFLGDARLPDGRSAEDLDAARFYIDLLEVVQQKTAGSLSAEESALLEDLLYRLRLRYVQKTG